MCSKVLHATVKPALLLKRAACNENYQRKQQKFNVF